LAVGTITDQDGGLLTVSVPCYCDTGAVPVYGGGRMRDRMAWRHVDRKKLVRAVKRLPGLRVKAGLTDVKCSDGACCWCGVRKGRGWRRAPYAWRDGRVTAFCGDCAKVWDRNGNPEVGRDLTAAFAEAVTGVPRMIGEPTWIGVPVLPYVAASDDREGHEDRWAWLDADHLDAIRLVEWGRYGGRYAPSDRRDQARAAYAATKDAARWAEGATELHRAATERGWG